MKKLMVVLTAMAFLMVSATVALADTQDVEVTAKITGTCQFNSAVDVAFGTLDQTVTDNAEATGSVIFWCTKNTNYTLSDSKGGSDGSLSSTMSNGSESISYSLTYSNYSGAGAGKTSPITSALAGTILNADYVDAEAGDYSDTITFTIAP